MACVSLNVLEKRGSGGLIQGPAAHALAARNSQGEHNSEKAQCSAERIQRRRAFTSQRADPATSPFLGQLAVEATPAEVGAARAVAR